MEESRTLPPLVRGKVTGFLDFFIDEVIIFRNILFLTDKCNIIVQAQWWGEKMPVYIIPQHICSKENHDICFNSQNTYYHSTTYTIKTKFDLFKSYLKTCEVLELAVLRAVENLVIGSAFMKDLIKLINNIHDPIMLPLVDSLGEEIGEVKIHTNFSQGPCRVSKNEYFSQSIDNSVLTNNSRDTIKGGECAKKIGSSFVMNYETPCLKCGDDFKKRDIYKTNQDGKVFQLNKSQSEMKKEHSNFVKTGFNLCENAKCEIEINQVSRSNEKCSSKNILSNIQEDYTQAKKELQSKSFPQSHILNDCSKVLYFDLQGGKKLKNSKKYLKTEKLDGNNTDVNVAKKKHPKISGNPDTLSGKLKSLSVKKKISTERKKGMQAFQKKLCKVHEDNEKEDNNFLKKLSKTTGINAQSYLACQNSSAKGEGDGKILNYLLGYSMSKDDEQSALNNLRRTSLSHNFVESINQLCTRSVNFYQRPKNNDNQEFTSHKFKTSENDSKKITHLKFDLSNTIERNYFKKFFISECSQNAFQIAEYLNTTKNSFFLENCGGVEINNHLNESSHFHTTLSENDLEKNFLSSAELQEGNNNLIEKDVINNAANGFWSHEKVPTDCSNCKYYKQFSELDTIIQSLKHFDNKSVKRKDN